ncbi:hypothetical protein EVAR_74613_1 [Eumeta japonica]|uniref:Uncharacterized protein n=1 Tax=Eumeta variegata TaxID=151549 RepID=A0A4C1W9P4_EUMVA|nr:hypothetical protein EVAR_74613_1 [Eumeta japonica]
MSVFDPLGLASPVLITGKCMLQDIWRSGIDWDETIEADAHKKWLKWVNDIKKLASIRIPRCISPGHTEGSYMAETLLCSSAQIKIGKHARGTREDEERSRRPHHNLKFIPRRSEHGWRLGRLVRSIKTALAATLRERSPREEVLHTLLLEAEHIVNSRPLTEVDVEPAEAESLTPNHFLIGRSAALPQRATLTTTCPRACKLAHVSAPRRSLLAEVVERILTDSGALPRAATLYAARRPRATSC